MSEGAVPSPGPIPGPVPGPPAGQERGAGLPDEASLLLPLAELDSLEQHEWPARYARVLEDLSAALEEDS